MFNEWVAKGNIGFGSMKDYVIEIGEFDKNFGYDSFMT